MNASALSGSRLLPWKMPRRASTLVTMPKGRISTDKRMCKSLECNSHKHTTSFSFRTVSSGIYTTLHDANSSSVLLAMLALHTGFKHETAASTIFAEVIHCIIARRGSVHSMYALVID